MIITLSSMIDVPKICIRTKLEIRVAPKPHENTRFPADSLGPPNHFSIPACYWSRL